MKETRKSLKVYFLLIGIVGLIASAITLVKYGNVLGYQIVAGIDIFFDTIFVYAGFNLDSFLNDIKKTWILKKLVVAAFFVDILGYLLTSSFIEAGGVILLGWYLIHNIKKLAVK